MKINFFFPFLLLFSYIVIQGCGSKQNPSDFDTDLTHCPQKPSAFFAPTMQGVASHEFSLAATKSVERVAFDNGSALEIIQSGCAKIKQQFVFSLPGNFAQAEASTAVFWTENAIQQFNTLAKLDPKLNGLAMWSSALNAVKADLKIQEPLELEPHRFISLDRIVSESSALLIVTLSEE
jgi:hypothetical protein